jgi:hypothetical protein
MSKPAPSKKINHRFVAVVDLGETADYRSEVRFQVSIELPFWLTTRSGKRQLEAACEQVRSLLEPVLPACDRRLHVWLLEPETGQPSLFVSGLLGIRQGQLTTRKAERLNSKIRPQVTRPRQLKPYRFLLNSTAHVWGCPEEFCDEDASDEEREYAVLDGILGCFDHCELIDSDTSGENDVYVAGEVWHTFMLELPFKPRKGSTETQLGYIIRQLEELVWQESCGDLYDLRLDETEVWLLDEGGQPCEYISGCLRVKDGSLMAAEMKKRSRRSLATMPLSLRSRAA